MGELKTNELRAPVDLTGIPPRASNGWPSLPARSIDRWIVGMDVGQSIDPSAISVLHHTCQPVEEWVPNAFAKHWRQSRIERFSVLHLERLRLGMSYPEQVAHVARLLSRDPLSRRKPELVIDYTGCGRPVADMFDRAGLRPTCILITAGEAVTRTAGKTWHVAKPFLISGLEARMHAGELEIASGIREAEVLRNELKDFSRKVSEATGRVQYSAREGAHDDLVLSVAIALFAATHRTDSSWQPLPY